MINTCSIREKSYHKAVSKIGQTRRDTGQAKPVIAVTGCVASHDGENLLKRFPFVDIALGPDHIAALPGLVREVQKNHTQVARTNFQDISDYEFPRPVLWNEGEDRKVTSYVTVMKGCDNQCSFCIVPFVRGEEVSKSSSQIIEEIQRLEEEGIREVMLLGQNVNSYGKKLGEKTDFATLLRMIDERTKVPRLRYISPHPKDLSKALIEEHARNSKLCPHIHLPLQSGSTRVLKRMRRSYTRDVFLRKVDAIKKAVPTIAITTDIIVGFPGETDAEFQETLSLLEQVGFDSSYCFLFSPRPNTEAAGFVDDVPLTVKKERFEQLEELQSSLSLKKNSTRVGLIEKVLVEGTSRDLAGQMRGRTPQGMVVNFVGDSKMIGAILPIEITEASAYSLKGVLKGAQAYAH